MPEIESLKSRAQQLDRVSAQIDMQRSKPRWAMQSKTARRGERITFFLVQASITRFGVLAVVGFFVSILVSLCRYNVRLAAFYMARADELRLFAPPVTVSDFSLIAAASSPAVEFGKAPSLHLASW